MKHRMQAAAFCCYTSAGVRKRIVQSEAESPALLRIDIMCADVTGKPDSALAMQPPYEEHAVLQSPPSAPVRAANSHPGRSRHGWSQRCCAKHCENSQMALANHSCMSDREYMRPRIHCAGKLCVTRTRAGIHARASDSRERVSAPPVSSKCRWVPSTRPLLASTERMAASSDRSRESSALHDAS